MVIDHIGIVVASLDKAIQQWESLFGYLRRSEIVENTRQRVKVVFLSKNDSLTVKLVEPIGDDSPVAAFARRGGGLHHLCFKCDNVNLQVPLLKERGARLIVPPEPGEAFNLHSIAFLLAGNANIELIDTAEKKGWTSSLDPSPRSQQ
jgi:methylmalonyl-CoA/ethylmalonyl-CoA epimerase